MIGNVIAWQPSALRIWRTPDLHRLCAARYIAVPTIIGIPFRLMCFRLAGSVIAPSGREVRETESPGGPLSFIMNILWIILPGLELAIMHLLLAAFFFSHDFRLSPCRPAYEAGAGGVVAVWACDAGC